MLLLTRRCGEGIDVGDNIRIVVKRCYRHRVTLGVQAPDAVRIRRMEIVEHVPDEMDLVRYDADLKVAEQTFTEIAEGEGFRKVS